MDRPEHLFHVPTACRADYERPVYLLERSERRTIRTDWRYKDIWDVGLTFVDESNGLEERLELEKKYAHYVFEGYNPIELTAAMFLNEKPPPPIPLKRKLRVRGQI